MFNFPEVHKFNKFMFYEDGAPNQGGTMKIVASGDTSYGSKKTVEPGKDRLMQVQEDHRNDSCIP